MQQNATFGGHATLHDDILKAFPARCICFFLVSSCFASSVYARSFSFYLPRGTLFDDYLYVPLQRTINRWRGAGWRSWGLVTRIRIALMPPMIVYLY